MEIYITILALLVAVWQLQLQRRETQRGNRINSLIHTSTLLKERIQFYERIIQDWKIRKKDWTSHANCVNNELQPLLYKANSGLFELIAKEDSKLDINAVKKALRLPALSDYE